MATSPPQSLQTIHAELEVLRLHNLVSMDQYFSILRQLPTSSHPNTTDNTITGSTTQNTSTTNTRDVHLKRSEYADPNHSVTMYSTTGQQYTATDFDNLSKGPGLPPLESPTSSSIFPTSNENDSQESKGESTKELKHIESKTFDPRKRAESLINNEELFVDASKDPENPACVKNPDHLDWAKRLGERLGSMAMMGNGIGGEDEEMTRK